MSEQKMLEEFEVYNSTRCDRFADFDTWEAACASKQREIDALKFAWKHSCSESQHKQEQQILELAAQVEGQVAVIEQLQDFGLWLTGCGYDFTQHEYFMKNRYLLALPPSEALAQHDAELRKEIARLNHQHANDEAANRMLSEACNNLREDRDRWKALETEAATYVESPIVLMTHFTGEHPYVGWKGLGLALTETLEKATSARASAIKECAALFSGGVRNRELYVNDVEEMILGLLKE